MYIIFNANAWFCNGALHTVLYISSQELLKVTYSCFIAMPNGVPDLNHLSILDPSVLCSYQNMIDLILLKHKHFLWCILIKENQIVRPWRTWRSDEWTRSMLIHLLKKKFFQQIPKWAWKVGKAHLTEISCPFEQEVLIHPPIKWRCPFKGLTMLYLPLNMRAMCWMTERLEFAS